jgi:hypothetical protein
VLTVSQAITLGFDQLGRVELGVGSGGRSLRQRTSTLGSAAVKNKSNFRLGAPSEIGTQTPPYNPILGFENSFKLASVYPQFFLLFWHLGFESVSRPCRLCASIFFQL